VLRLTRSFFGKEDLALTQRLVTELPAILQWAMVGRDRLAERGYFVQPESARQAVTELEDLASPIGAFLRDRCLVGAAHSVECGELYAAWLTWCAEQHRDHPGTVQVFGRDLRAAVPEISSTQPRDGKGDRERHYQGVGLDPKKMPSKDDKAAEPPRDGAAEAAAAGPPPGRFSDRSTGKFAALGRSTGCCRATPRAGTLTETGLDTGYLGCIPIPGPFKR